MHKELGMDNILIELDNSAIIEKRIKDLNSEEFDFDNQEIVWGGDFETKWRVEDLMVSLKVIFAGGHNIQRFHPRILVNVK